MKAVKGLNLSDADKLMFSNFLEWYNGLKKTKARDASTAKIRLFKAF